MIVRRSGAGPWPRRPAWRRHPRAARRRGAAVPRHQRLSVHVHVDHAVAAHVDHVAHRAAQRAVRAGPSCARRGLPDAAAPGRWPARRRPCASRAGPAPAAATRRPPRRRRDQVGVADELGHEARGRTPVDVGARAGLFDGAGAHHDNAVGHAHGLFLVVRDKDEGDAQPGLQVLELKLHALAQLQVQRRQRLVQQQQLGPVDDGARQRHALLLSSGHLARVARAELGQAHHVQRRPRALSAASARDAP